MADPTTALRCHSTSLCNRTLSRLDGSPQDAVTVRGMDVTNGNPSGTPAYYEANVHNVNNAARNLVEIIANDARARYAGNTNAPYPIRIYTIGMGPSLKTLYGTRPEYGEDILEERPTILLLPITFEPTGWQVFLCPQ